MNQPHQHIDVIGEVPDDWLQSLTGCVLDMDGVIYRGDTLIPEAKDFLDALDAAGIAWAMATNNSTASPQQYVEKLARMGIDAPASRIVTSGIATATYLRSRFARGTSIYVVGMDALNEALFSDGYFTPAAKGADVVVSGADFNLRYDDLKIGCLAIRNGASYVATNADKTFPSEEGLIPGSGAVVAALTASTGVDPVVVGKPSPEMLRSCLTIIDSDAQRTLMVGDRLDTDILAGKRAGLLSLLVLTGVSTRDDVTQSGIRPDLIAESLSAITTLLRRSVREKMR